MTQHPTTDNHDYPVPEPGTYVDSWGKLINDELTSRLEADIEIRDTDANQSNYTPKAGAKYFSTDTGDVYVCTDDSTWTHLGQIGDHGGDDIGSASTPVNSITNIAYREHYAEATISGSHTIDATDANVHYLTLSGDATLSITDSAGDTSLASSVMVIIKQDGTGGHSVSWDGDIRWQDGSAPSLTTTANEADVLTFTSTMVAAGAWVGMKSVGPVNYAELGSPPETTPSYIDTKGVAWWPVYEGANDTIDDHLGTHDGSLDAGVSWLENVGVWVEDYALSFSGSEAATTTGLGTWGSQLDTDWAIAVTIETSDASADQHIFEAHDGQWVVFGQSKESLNGELSMWIQDQDGIEHEIESASAYADSGRYRVVWNKTGNTASDHALYVNGSQVSTTTVTDGGTLSTFSDFTNPLCIGGDAVNNGQYYIGTLDDPIIFNDSLTSTEISDDYARQPWST